MTVLSPDRLARSSFHTVVLAASSLAPKIRSNVDSAPGDLSQRVILTTDRPLVTEGLTGSPHDAGVRGAEIVQLAGADGRRSLPRLSKGVAARLLAGRSGARCPFVPPTRRLTLESYWRVHPIRAVRLMRALASRSGAPSD
jgi:hypothetical protein